MAGLAGIDLLGRGIKAGAKALDYDIPKNIEPFLTPVSTAKDYLTSKLEEAIGVPKDTISAVTDPKGFVSNVVKDTAKDYFKEKVEIPEEDRSFSSSDGGGKGFERDFEYGGGGGKPQFDEAGMSMTAMKRGGKVKSAPKSKVSTASSRGDGIAQRGKTRGRMV